MMRRAVFGAGLAALLSACGTSLQTSSLLVAPGKYDIYTCAQIADRMQDVDTEGKKLEGLMARASQDASGRFVSNIAYEPDYLTNRGEMNELRKSAAAKNCTNLPVAVAPGKRASDTVIR
jgi:hypothetical protein